MALNESILSESDYAHWLTPFEAAQRLIAAGLEDREHAVSWLTARLQSGELRASGIWYDFDADYNPINERICIWLPKVWERAQRLGWKSDFWISGNYSDPDDALESHGILPSFFSLIDTRFEPDLIQSFCDLALDTVNYANAQHPTPPTKHAGGRPPKAFWDDLWANIAAQLYNGDLKPERQADIEKAMHDWLALNDQNAGETAVRAKAKLLWLAIQAEVTN